MAATLQTLVALLAEARELSNQTLRNASRVALWHIAVDKALKGHVSDATERYDAPERVKHRKRVDELFQ